MNELEHILYDHNIDAPELFSERYLLERQRPDALRDFIAECGAKIVELRRLELLAGDVLEGYGE